jgi:hypothetical protein
VALLNFLCHSVLEEEAELAMNKLPASLGAVIAVCICACGQTAEAPVAQSPSNAPAAVTLESISSQPADLPSVGLQKCSTGLFTSGDLSTINQGIPEEWPTVQRAGAVEGWVQKLILGCPGDVSKARIRNDVIRFSDAAAATAFFQSEKKNARSSAILWPIGGIAREGSQTGLGPNSVSMALNAMSYCALWSNGPLLISYCLVNFSSANGLKGALAVNARIPKA